MEEKLIVTAVLSALASRLKAIEKLKETNPEVALLARVLAFQQSRKTLRRVIR